jgi:outer membrane protein TolC
MKRTIPVILGCLLAVGFLQIKGTAVAETKNQAPTSTGTIQELSEADCIELGLKNNSEIKAATTQKAISFSDLAYAKSLYYPKFEFRYDGGGTNSNFFLLEGTPAVVPQNKASTASAGNRLFYNYEGRMTLPLVQDGVLGFGSHRISRANFGVEQSNYKLEATKRDTIASVKDVFLSVQKSQVEQEIQKEAVSQFKEILRLVKEKFSRGLASMKDVLQAETNLAQAEADLASWQHDYERLLKQLFMTIKVPTTSRVRVSPLPKTLPPLPPWPQVVEKISHHNLDLKAKKLDIDMAKEDLSLSKTKLWPTVDVITRYFASQNELQDFKNFYAGYAFIQIPIFEYALYKDVSTKKLNVTLAKDKYQVSTDSAIRSATDQYKTLQDIPLQINASRKKIQYLEENYRESKAKYQQNLISFIDLTKSLVDLNTAKKVESEMYFSYKSGYINLQNLMGEEPDSQGKNS